MPAPGPSTSAQPPQMISAGRLVNAPSNKNLSGIPSTSNSENVILLNQGIRASPNSDIALFVKQHRDHTTAPLYKLTVDLIKTYKGINEVKVLDED